MYLKIPFTLQKYVNFPYFYCQTQALKKKQKISLENVFKVVL
jgi:hypothetical protein